MTSTFNPSALPPTLDTQVHFKVSVCTGQHLGDRVEQQDRITVMAHPRYKGMMLAVVADGMGGRTGGAMAAQQVVASAKSVFELYTHEDSTPEKLLEQIVVDAHTVIKLIAISAEKDPHSTIVVFLLMPSGQAYWIHVGDSRLYHFSGPILNQRTVDHSYVQQLVKQGRITEAEAANHQLSNLLTSSLGTAEMPQFSLSRLDCVQPGDSFLLCSDGLWHYFSERELGYIMAANPPRAASEFLINTCRTRAKGTGDNVSLVIVKIEEPDPEKVAAAERAARQATARKLT
ncbi:PP2C family protein-serine/threonine phosphatase [Ampullimonas aquatilis]|uniref:PP2C family protein-serine/threonine phosphatase n=1 Tax=Ampullimonas aquatilis TaxID=1341549 RepID=UPI003C71885A